MNFSINLGWYSIQLVIELGARGERLLNGQNLSKLFIDGLLHRNQSWKVHSLYIN